MLQGSHRSRWVGVVILVCLFLSACASWAQHNEHDQTSVHEEVITGPRTS